MILCLPQTVYFNFHYLPFSQAVKLPVFLYKPRLRRCKGRVVLNPAGAVRPGMIQLGIDSVPFYPSRGITWENEGTVIFRGSCYIGNDSCISTGKGGNIVFGDHFSATAAFKIASYCGITFGNKVCCGWDCVFFDTDFHQMKTLEGKKGPKPYGAINIGDDCWFGLRSVVQKNSVLPCKTTVASCSLVNKAYDIPEATIIAGQPAKAVRTGLYRDNDDDAVDYGLPQN